LINLALREQSIRAKSSMLTLSLEKDAGYRAMDQQRAIKTLLRL
jgi:hypothetical protein